MYHRTFVLLGACLVAGAIFAAEPHGLPGENPNPIHLVRRPVEPLSAMAELGREIFFDTRLSSSGKMSCASCHSPDHAYGPPNDGPVMLGGPALAQQGGRAVPSLTYLERQRDFSIEPDDRDRARVNPAEKAATRAQKTATQTSQSAANMVPEGGLFWDGRADTLQNQASGPLLDPREMDGGSIEIIAEKLRHAPYAKKFAGLFGERVFKDDPLLVAQATFAVGRYQLEEPSFHPYTSKYDYWLEGKARLSESEMRGFRLFNDPDRANCGGCHISRPTRDGLPPLFTDFRYEASGGPRNSALTDTQDPNYFDLGICGPVRKDIADQTQFCGMFKTPTLRNTTVRRAFFHNGAFQTLQQVMDFYNFRDTSPEKVYPLAADGKAQKFNDIPVQYHANVDVSDPPFDRHLGEAPAMTAQDEADIIEFLKTLKDGYKLARQAVPTTAMPAPAPPTGQQVAVVAPRVTRAVPAVGPCGGPGTVSFSTKCGSPLTATQEHGLKPKDSFRECNGCPEMVVMPAGSFTMGSPSGEKDRDSDEGPQHVVTIGRPFAVGKWHVTVDQFGAFVRETGYAASSKCYTYEGSEWKERADRSWHNPGFVQEGSHPVVCVNWDDAKAYVDWIAKKTGKPYRLLSEAEWEYAARGRTSPGIYPRFWFGDDQKDLCRYGNFRDQKVGNAGAPCNDGYDHISPAGQFAPNAFGLYDMAGNAWQWTADCYHDSYNGAPADGSAWTTRTCNSGRVFRGGSWNSDPWALRAAGRLRFTDELHSIGFRIARTLI